MREEYDLTKMKPRPNPYARRLRRQTTIRLGEDVIEYFKAMAAESGLSYQRLIDLYLRDCMVKHRKIVVEWSEDTPTGEPHATTQ